eukprot:TRINITY_DN7879_c0_g1_i8.p1 TRINITY_DN7879_c0_g1~~TRINITY_DN7879_c0_g1_i8.p1  ORF type:complete len:167 (-),score=3.39 TRINITY_DN7879_c0_g1_i8:229-729(-)
MQEILRPLLGRGVEVFLDDILVYTHDVRTHQDLEHIISAGGISVGLRKIDAIVEWPLPQDITQLRGFLGMAGFYRRFIQGFSKIAVPLTDALKQSLKLPLQLSAEAVAAFHTLKTALSSAPVLAVADPQSPIGATGGMLHRPPLITVFFLTTEPECSPKALGGVSG